MMDIGSCSIHMVHNSFSEGMDSFSLCVDGLVIKIYYFFRKSDLRWSNYRSVQIKKKVPFHRFEKHVKTRWLTLGSAAKKISEQLPALESYFLDFIPKNEKKNMQFQSYIDIVKYLDNLLLICYLNFTVRVSFFFNKHYTGLMQLEEPLIHLLYEQIKILS